MVIKFKELIEDIPKHRERIKKAQAKKKDKEVSMKEIYYDKEGRRYENMVVFVSGGKVLDSNNNIITYDIEGVTFVFDEVGFKLYKTRFENDDIQSIAIINSEKQRYLGKLDKNYNVVFFHRWLKEQELNVFRIEKEEKGVVHHKNFDSQDNREENLQVMSRTEHDFIHNRR